MQAGTLRHPLTVQRPVVTQAADGAQQVTWQTVGMAWGAIRPLRATEQLVAAQTAGRQTHRITLRAPLAITETSRLLLRDGRIFEPIGVLNVDERTRTYLINAVEVTSGAGTGPDAL